VDHTADVPGGLHLDLGAVGELLRVDRAAGLVLVQRGSARECALLPIAQAGGSQRHVPTSRQAVRVGQSTAADLNATVVPAAGSTWIINVPTGYISTGVLAGGSAPISVRNVWSSTNTDQPVSARCFQSTAADLNVTAIYPANYISTAVLGGNSSALSVRNVWSSTNTDQPVSARCFQSTGTDLQMTCANFSTAVLATIATNLQSSAAPSSNSSGLVVRLVVDNILTTASTNAFAASTSFSIQSSGASLRSYVVAYSILSTNAGPHKVKFYSSGTMTWPVIFAAVSSAVSGANLAVSAPGYLFRTASQEALTLQLGSGASTIGGYQVAVSYFRAP
jgi:hypothetical protein